ncbi:MAG: hypothetical protein NTV01_01100 [Bacteroidia bacterium]|nr:hypothetical protein [Bacteroidia bacterium]
MKAMNLIKIALVILLGITFSVKVQGDNDKNLIKTSGYEVPDAEMLFTQPVEDWMFDSDYLNEEQAVNIEAWMMDSGYLSEEVQPLESWMFSENRLSETTSERAMEPWMFDANYLSR